MVKRDDPDSNIKSRRNAEPAQRTSTSWEYSEEYRKAQVQKLDAKIRNYLERLDELSQVDARYAKELKRFGRIRQKPDEAGRWAQLLLRAARGGDDGAVRGFIRKGVDVNLCDVRTGATALHNAAAVGARAVLRVLLETDQCDFLIRDRQGRLASELAAVHGRDPAMAKLLLKKESRQAWTQGVPLRRRDRSKNKV